MRISDWSSDVCSSDLSLSRVMADVVPDEHRMAAAAYRRLWAAYEENRDLILMGAYRPGNDPVIDEAVQRRQEILDFIRQDQKSFIDLDTSAAALIASSDRSRGQRSEEHTSELQSLMRTSYAVFCLKKKITPQH